MTPLEQRIERLESMMRAIIDNISPLMSFAEVQRVLGYKSKTSVTAWLKARGIKRSGRGYRRVEVIAAATDDRANP